MLNALEMANRKTHLATKPRELRNCCVSRTVRQCEIRAADGHDDGADLLVDVAEYCQGKAWPGVAKIQSFFAVEASLTIKSRTPR